MISRLALFAFNMVIPDWYFLKYVKSMALKLAGVHTVMGGSYVLSPVYFDCPSKVTWGEGVFVNRGCVFEGNGKIILKDRVQVGPYTVFATSNHELGNMDVVTGDVVVHDNVWIGAHVTLVQGVVLGPNVVVGAGAVVTRSFSNAVVAGVPARIVKSLAKPAGGDVCRADLPEHG